jgi:outer membrane protein assembly factor BamB
MIRWGKIAALAWFAVGCGGGGAVPANVFSTGWQSDAGQSIARVEAKLRSAPRPLEVAIAVGVTADGLVGSALPEGKRIWRHSGAVDVVPSIAPNGVVFASGGGEAFALDGQTGEKLWRVAVEPMRLRGAADDGKLSVLSLGKAGTSKSRLIAVDRSGNVVFDQDASTELGRPAIRAGVAFVPWGGQYVSAIDVATGDEIGRLLTRDMPSHALDVNGTLYFGQHALVRFDERIKFAESFQATRRMFKFRELPGTPVWLGDGLALPEIDRSARARIRLLAAPESTPAGIGVASGSYAGSYFRAVYGFSAQDDHLIWADALEADVVGGAPAASGFVFCDNAGKVHLYDATGGTAPVVDLRQKLVVCAVGATALRVTGSPRGPLALQIENSFRHLDPDMAAAEALLIAELGKLEDREVTRILIALAEEPRVPPPQREQARALLAKRENGAEFMLEALERHYDFVTGSQAPPVGPLADALARLKDVRAAAPLARHLNDPADSMDDVVRAAKALEVVATSAQSRDLATFFALYRATADDEGLVRAVLSVAAALLRVGGADARALIDRAASDPLTQPDVQRGLAKLIAPKAQPAPPANAKVAPGAKPQPTATGKLPSSPVKQ